MNQETERNEGAEQQEEKQKLTVKRAVRNLFIGIGITLLVLFICLVLEIMTENREARKNREAKHETMTGLFTECMETYYGLKKGDYIIVDEYFRRHSADVHGCTFTVDDTEYSEVNGYTDYCSKQLRDVLAEQFSEALQAAGISDAGAYTIEKIEFDYSGKDTIFDAEMKDKLPFWMNEEEIQKYKDGSYSSHKWADELTLRIVVRTDSKEAASLSEGIVKKLEFGPFSDEELIIETGSQTYTYKIR